MGTSRPSKAGVPKHAGPSVAEIRLDGLFGRFNHAVKVGQRERLTILTAPNGYGKTALLNLVNFLFRKEFLGLQAYPYKELTILLDDRRGVSIAPRSMDLLGNASHVSPVLVFSPINIQNADSWEFDRTTIFTRDEPIPFERYVPYLDRLTHDRWVDERTGQVYSTIEVVEKFRDQLPERFRRTVGMPEWLSHFLNSVKCHLIETQRLLDVSFEPDYVSGRRRNAVPKPVVERNAQQLATRMSAAIQAYGLNAQKLDQSQPKRVLLEFSKPPQAESAIRERLTSLEAHFSELVSVGLIDKSLAPQITQADVISADHTRNFLNVYVQDTENKLGVYAGIYRRIKLFQELVNSHLSFKGIRVDRQHGMVIHDDQGNTLPLSALSSGEQHELILIYELLFQVDDHALILIDEPELSLHVAWQKRFIADLERIQAVVPMNIVLATHSPQIINDRWDLVVELSAQP